MKREELFIGALVNYLHTEDGVAPYKEPIRISAEDMCRDECVIEAHFEPIPFTPEILEKNGFKCCDNITKDEFMPFVLDGMDRKIPYEVIIKWRDSYDNGAFDAFNHVSWGESWTLHCNCGVRTFDIEGAKTIYVHELQAAMRLCEIEKEIVL